MNRFLFCTLLLLNSASAGEPAKVDFATHIAPIVHSKCSMCHRQGQPGPFELLSYDDVRERGLTIQAVIHDRYMPPWKPVNEDVEFAHDRRLTKAEIRLIDEWIDAEMPAGDLSRVKAPDYSSGWALGKPDAILKMNGRFMVPASGRDVYRSFVFEADFPEDKWVKAVELRPTARGAVHHALFFVDTSGEARSRDGQDGKAGLSGMSFLRQGGDRQRGSLRTRSGSSSTSGVRGLGGYVPGAMPNKLPGDLALPLPKGGDIVMQTHFHPSGKVEYEQAELALYFADRPPARQIVPIQLPPLFGRLAGIDVPAGESDFEIRESFTLPVDVEAVQISGHAHYICREMELTATLPGGTKIDMLSIDDWDLDWQDNYQFREPVMLPAGTRLDARLMYDNSAENPENPHSPPRRIKWGRESTDEMGSVTLQVVAKRSSDRIKLQQATRQLITRSFSKAAPRGTDRARGGNIRGQILDGRLIQLLDRNKDGKLQKTEIPQRLQERFLSIGDTNNDNVIDEQEIKRALSALGGTR